MNKKIILVKCLVGVLMLTSLITVTPAQATVLKATGYNTNMLSYHVGWTPYSYGYLMPYQYAYLLDANPAYMKPKQIGTITATTTTNYIGSSGFWGQCVSFANLMSKTNVLTRYWYRGDNVMSTYNVIAPGTYVATFTYWGYADHKPGFDPYGNDHVGLFKGYTYDAYGRRNGIEVWDQNFLPGWQGVVAKHKIGISGSGTSNANNFYVVNI